jgi:hypothetical protein
VAAETVVVLCATHNRRVKAGSGGSIVHISGNGEAYCSAARFEVRLVRQAGRDEVTALLTAATREDEGP